MVATLAGSRLEEISEDLFEVVTQVCMTVPRGRRRNGDLKEIEFQTLAILQERGTMIVGDIQRMLGVLPAQMSRVIRSLETRRGGLISCRINPSDKRKIDVCITEHGEKACHEYRAARVKRLSELLHDLTDEEQGQVIHLLDRIRGLLDRHPGS